MQHTDGSQCCLLAGDRLRSRFRCIIGTFRPTNEQCEHWILSLASLYHRGSNIHTPIKHVPDFHPCLASISNELELLLCSNVFSLLAEPALQLRNIFPLNRAPLVFQRQLEVEEGVTMHFWISLYSTFSGT